LLFALAGSTLAFQTLHRREKARRIATEELLVEARYDPVTDLPNRRQFEEELDRSVSRAARSNEKRAVFFIDLDGFKKINDLLGHATGDDLLKAVGQALTNAVRKGDFVARLSGDEFAVIMDSPTCETARELAERLVSEVSRPLLPSHPSSRVSCSLGIAVFGVDAWDAKELVKLADTAMYASKRAGKARVTWIGDLIPTVPAEEPLPESLAAIAGLREIARRT
jgi:diguanylate cyclase (GGDEF)-like protein